METDYEAIRKAILAVNKEYRQGLLSQAEYERRYTELTSKIRYA